MEISVRSLQMHNAQMERYAARQAERAQREAQEAYARSQAVRVAAENRREVQRISGKVRGELNTLLQAQAKENYGSAAGAGGTTFGASRTRTAEEEAEEDFVERWNEWRLGEGVRPSNSEVDHYTFRRGIEKLYPQLAQVVKIKYGGDSPMLRGAP